jgi:hypothetical protein
MGKDNETKTPALPEKPIDKADLDRDEEREFSEFFFYVS